MNQCNPQASGKYETTQSLGNLSGSFQHFNCSTVRAELEKLVSKAVCPTKQVLKQFNK